jgi:hypothetical protein
MDKDIIYIDAEDDITAIIGKIKASKEKIIALVPPKHASVLQSAVNLRLLERAAKTEDKRLVLITNDRALIALSAFAKIPIAKNLQSKPELAEIPALEIDDGKDIIDGSQLSVGELSKTADRKPSSTTKKIKVNNLLETLDGTDLESKDPNQKLLSNNKATKVPDFKKFRKRLFIIVGAILVLVTTLVWATWFAPAATIVITAKTTDTPVSTKAVLSSSANTSFKNGTLKSVTQQIEKKDASINFEATGSQTKGDKATGIMTLTRSLGGSVSIPAGSSFNNGSYTFVTTSNAIVPGRGVPDGEVDPVNGVIDVEVIAADLGPEYNLSPRLYQSSVNGITASGGQMSGGSRQTVKIVTASDVQTARKKLVEQSSDDVKQDLSDKFSNNYTVISSSFTTEYSEVVSTPEVGGELTEGSAKLTSKIIYSLTAVTNVELGTYIEDTIKHQLSETKEDKKVYDTGIDKARLNDFNKDGDTSTVNVVATGKVGPQINEDDLKEQAKGKRFGEVQSQLEKIDGVSSIDVKFSFFWVRVVPNNVDKIDIEFNLEDA